MKKQMITSSSKHSLVSSVLVGLLTMVLCAVTVPRAHAQGPGDGIQPLVSYLGRVGGQPMLLVEFSNPEERSYNLTIKDPYGTQLYSNDFNDKKFVKRFQVAQEEPGDMKLTLTFSSGKIRETRVVEINTRAYVKEDFQISKP